MDLDFKWDPNKEQINIKKHGITFSTAMNVFYDEHRLVYFDSDNSLFNEDRYQVIGMVKERLIILFVAYTIRLGSYRIISARRATKAEEKRYYANYKKTRS